MKEIKRLLSNKKFITFAQILLIGVLVLLFATGCNKQVVDFDYTFDKAICVLGGETKEIDIKSWKDYDGEQLQIIDKEGNKYLVSSFNCVLVKEA